MIVRPAEWGDLDRVVEMLRAFHAEAEKEAQAPFSEEAVWLTCRGMLDSEAAFLGLLEAAEGPVGVLGGLCHRLWYSTARAAQEVFWYVEPRHRGQGVRLLRAFEAWARERGVGHPAMIGLANERSEGMDRLYRRLGYEPVERLYRKV